MRNCEKLTWKLNAALPGVQHATQETELHRHSRLINGIQTKNAQSTAYMHSYLCRCVTSNVMRKIIFTPRGSGQLQIKVYILTF